MLSCLMMSCKVQEAPVPETKSEAESCNSIGTVMENDCGLYIAIENGPNIYIDASSGFDLSVGAKIRIGFYRTYGAHVSTCSGEGYCGCGATPQNKLLSVTENCMVGNGISLAQITCIEAVDDRD